MRCDCQFWRLSTSKVFFFFVLCVTLLRFEIVPPKKSRKKSCHHTFSTKKLCDQKFFFGKIFSTKNKKFRPKIFFGKIFFDQKFFFLPKKKNSTKNRMVFWPAH